MFNFKLWRGLTAVLGILLAIVMFMSALLFEWSGHVNVFLNIKPPSLTVTDETNFYKSSYGLTADGLTAMLSDSDKHDIQTMEEGAVLLKNDSAALPLSATERRVTLFGRSVADPVYRGNSGGPSANESRQATLYSSLSEAGFVINNTLFDAYKNSPTKRTKPAIENTTGQKASIGEENSAFYTSALKASYANDFNDVAIVMFSRDGGEGKDLFPNDIDGVSQLALHQQESDLLKVIVDSGKFDKTIVLINSAYAMELEWLSDAQYGVDAALWIGGTGLLGFKGVANILTGKADPSGRFVDTYATDSLSSAAVQNAFSFTFANDKRNYIIEAEGIYTGYKYYETRYQDTVLGINNASGTKGAFASTAGWNYAEEMAYPFGYGTSYASFSQELVDLDWNRTTHKVTATVKVTNNGYPAGSTYTGKSKSVVQLYVQLPYSSGNTEKSAIQLIDFGKTKLIGIGETDEVTFEVDDYIFASYDNKAVNGADSAKKGCYVFDKGNYYFAIGDDSHDALNNVIAAKVEKESLTVVGSMTKADGTVVSGDADKVKSFNVAALDNTSYAKSQYTGNVMSNQFDDVDINSFYDNDIIQYLTRKDWNTFPQKYTSITAAQSMIDVMNGEPYVKPSDAPAYSSFKQGSEVTTKLIEMKEVGFDDPKWEKFLDQLTVSQMCQVIGENFGQPSFDSIGKPTNSNSDGPDGAQGSYKYGSKIASTVHVNEVVASSTWNKQILADRGNFIAEDCLFVGTSQLWSPGANLHRTPFSGRNFEYYSEDGVMSYICGAVQTKAMQAKGVCAAIKHFTGNDQETNRAGLHIFANEQGLREGSFKGFEGAFTQGGALGTMMSFSSLGAISEFYAHTEVLTNVLRGEWGFKGVTITDSVKGQTLDTIACLVAGTDTFNADTTKGTDVQKYLATSKDGNALQALRLANKRFYYAMTRTSMINGLTVDSVIPDFTPWWQTALKAVCGVACGLTAICIGMFVYSAYFHRRKSKNLGGRKNG